jgi:hypothetical protein
MQKGRFIHLSALAGALVLAAGGMQPAHGAAINTPAAPLLTPGDGKVLVTFDGVLGAAAYNVYSSNTASGAGTLVNAQPIADPWLVDDGAGKGLKNGAPLFYAVKAVMPDKTEGPASAQAVTTPAPPLLGGLVAYNIGTLNPGSATYDPTAKMINVRAAGADVWDATDQQTFTGTAVSGDFTITAKIPAPPTIENGGSSNDGKIGLEMRTSLDAGSPYAMVFASVMRDPEVLFEGHFTPEGVKNDPNTSTTFSAGNANTPTFADIKFPVWVRLSRSGTMMTAQQSEDGTKWDNVTAPQDFSRLPDTLYVGIGATAHDDTQYLDGQIDGSSLTLTTP